MKEYSIDRIRNIGLVGHGGAGKTTLSEALLYTMGATTRLGKIAEGTTVSDYHPDEIERKVSIETSLLHGEWKEWKINILDMPGYSDFLGGAKGSFRVVDAAVVVLNGVEGLEVGTDQVLEFADGYGTPRLFFVNRMDNEHSDFDKVLQMTRDRFGNGVVAFQFPANHGEGFNRIVDLLKMKLLTFEPDSKGRAQVSDLPADLAGKAQQMRQKIVEAAAESDDDLLNQFFEAGDLTDEQVQAGLRKGILAGKLYPVLCGSAERNIGSAELMDFVGSYGPAPDDFIKVQGFGPDGKTAAERKISETDPLSCYVFKTISEAHVGELSLIRVYSGILKSGEEALNSTAKQNEKVGQIYLLNGKTRHEIGQLKAGDIGALVKLKYTATGNTLCDKKAPFILPPVHYPEPVFSIAVKPKSRGDEDKISHGLHVLHEEDPSFKVVVDPELHQTILSGQGDLHLRVILNRLRQKFGVEVTEERPKIPYRETITGKSDEKYRHKKQTGGAGQFAEVWMRVEPLPTGGGFEFENIVKGGAISGPFIPSIEKGVHQVLESGPLAGYRVVDVKAIVYDGKEHPVDSKDIAFQVAGREVFKECVLKARPILLEPIYDVEIKIPEDSMGDVMGDLSGRRGKIMGMDSTGRMQIIKAKVPLAELDQYATTLRSITSGRGLYARTFSHYEPVPKDQEMRIIEEYKKSKSEVQA
ncbi:elongation factor G [bacterium]|nr:elongation factor G [bacterium]